jgi:hypothetical protein
MVFNCKDFIYRKHALERLLSRNISPDDVEATIKTGEIINEYPDDDPFKSWLVLGFIGKRPIHVVLSQDIEGNCIIITTYVPDNKIWNVGFKTKKR